MKCLVGLFVAVLLVTATTEARQVQPNVAALALARHDIMLNSDISSRDLHKFNDNSGKIECRWQSDIPGALLCLTTNKEQLAELFGRISCFVEGKGRLIVKKGEKPNDCKEQFEYIGHNLKKEDILEFYKQVDEKCKTDQDYCLSANESALKNALLEGAKEKGFENFGLFSAQRRTFSTPAVVSHELLHARFFLNKDYRATVEDFWKNKVTQEDKNELRAILRQTYPAITDQPNDEILVNEFQAYLLMLGAENYVKYKPFADKYTQELRSLLSPFMNEKARPSSGGSNLQ